MDNDTSQEDYEYYEASLKLLWAETDLDAALNCVFHKNMVQVTSFMIN